MHIVQQKTNNFGSLYIKYFTNDAEDKNNIQNLTKKLEE